jgi:hypothetical protein
MKKILASLLCSAALLLTAAELPAQAQTKAPAPRHDKNSGAANPNAEANIQLVREYVNTLVAGNPAKARMLVASNYKGYGPSAVDSSTIETVVSMWEQNYKTESNRKLSILAAQAFRIESGNLKGNWVALWGNYSFIQNGKNASFPVQYTAHVTDGKIDRDIIYYDRLFVLQTLGYKLTPPAAATATAK